MGNYPLVNLGTNNKKKYQFFHLDFIIFKIKIYRSLYNIIVKLWINMHNIHKIIFCHKIKYSVKEEFLRNRKKNLRKDRF